MTSKLWAAGSGPSRTGAPDVPGGIRGQASVELIAVLPALILVGMVLLQVGAAGYTYTLVDGAAEAGAIALAAGLPAESAVRRSLPGWARDRVEVSVSGRSRVEVTVRAPSPFGAVAKRVRFSSVAAIAEPRR